MTDPKNTDPKKESKKEEKLLDHNYDGVQELDNPLPAWWVYLFYATLVFGAVYFVVFTFFMKSSGERADEAVAKIRAAGDRTVAASAASGASNAAGVSAAAPSSEAASTADASVPAPAEPAAPTAGLFPKDAAALAKGKEIYTAKCLACHGAAGEGLIGPNMTDKYWLHGKGSLEDMYQVVVNGVPEKGMISWKPLLKDEEIRAVVVYVDTLKGTNPPNPKAPQGELAE